MPQQQNKWCYCEESTKAHFLAHAFSNQIQQISELLKEEGAKHTPFNNELAFNLDEIESELASREKRNKRNTMDMACCVIKSKKKQALLTEIKLKVKNERNIGAEELKQKIAGSKTILSKDINIQIHQTHLFIFNEKVKQRAQYRIRSLFADNPNYKVLSVGEFYQSYFMNQ